MRGSMGRLFRDESGQELVEYALVGATIGLAMAVSFHLILAVLATAYQSWLGAFDGLWEPPVPGG
jgi:Flp pilus assembly pilin Flp